MSMKTEETSLLWYPDWHLEMNFSTKKTDKFGKLIISSVISHCVGDGGRDFFFKNYF